MAIDKRIIAILDLLGNEYIENQTSPEKQYMQALLWDICTEGQPGHVPAKIQD